MSGKQRIWVRAVHAVGQRSPFNRGIFRRFLAPLLRDGIQGDYETTFRGVPFVLHMDNTTEIKMLFNRYDATELDFVRATTSHVGAVFVDIGANCGLYTQSFLFHAPEKAVCLSIEPNPKLVERVQANASLIAADLQARGVRHVISACAVGGEDGVADLDLGAGLGSASLHARAGDQKITVPVRPLVAILADAGINHIDALKIDIEGFEDRALAPFFAAAPQSLWPRHVLIEHSSGTDWDVDIIERMIALGYRETNRTRGNLMLTLKD